MIKHADGTDDAQVVVTVVDAKGKPLSNTPDVTLTVVSGPGGFPTGRSITFRKGTDIPILDGQAAIEFRSYYSGTTRIQASSPGLPDQQLTVISMGAPQYQAGKTPEFLPGPYVRFIGVQQTEQTPVANLLLDRPTNASSSASGHSSKLATDGDVATYWAAAPDATGPQWWESDLEGVYSVHTLTVLFAGTGSYTYEIQTSNDDRLSWKTVRRGVAESNGTPVVIEMPAKTTSSGLRIQLDAVPVGVVPGLKEVTLSGVRSTSIF